MSLRSRLLVALAAVTTGVAPAAAADAEQEFVKKVNRAIEKGKNFLVQQERGKGNWEGVVLGTLGDQVGGQTALATLALLNAGVKPGEPAVKRAIEFLRDLPPKKTYVVGLTTMVLAEARDSSDLTRIQRNADWLIANAMYQNGKLVGWSYPLNIVPDGSNTQYAVLGLYAAKQAGAKVEDRHWAAIRDLYSTFQVEDSRNTGFWQYDYSRGAPKNMRGIGQSGPSFTMTVAGVCGLLVAGMGLDDTQQRLDPDTGVAANCGVYAQNPAIARGMNWIAGRFGFGLGEGGRGGDRLPGLKWAYYNVYGIERLGRLSGQRFIGRYDWYREGCDEVVKRQKDDGSWQGPTALLGEAPVIDTAFALLFLSKGRTPVLLTKLAYGDAAVGESGLLVERGDEDGKVGWNRKQNDARHLAEFASRELFNGLPLGWQVYDSRRVDLDGDRVREEVETLLASPVMYLNGHRRPVLNGQQKELVKRYVDEGGFLFAEACCGSREFADGFRELMTELFPENKLAPMPAEHPVWRSFFQVSPADFKGVECLDRGCKTVVVLTTSPMAGYWEEERYQPKRGVPATSRGQRAYQFAGNVIAYATGMQPPEQKGTRVKLADPKADASPPRGAFKPVQLKLPGETAPAPAAMRNLLAYTKAAVGLEAAADKRELSPGSEELFKYKFMYAHGRRAFALSDDEIDNIRMNLETGGLLFADAACGKPEFDRAFREFVKKLYPDRKLELIPPEDELYSQKLNGTAIRTVKRREKADGAGPDGGYRDLPPHLEGVKIDGRWVVLYSKYDIGCSLERRVSTDCLGHTPESATLLGSAAVLYALKR
jgi:hypothetical protein